MPSATSRERCLGLSSKVTGSSFCYCGSHEYMKQSIRGGPAVALFDDGKLRKSQYRRPRLKMISHSHLKPISADAGCEKLIGALCGSSAALSSARMLDSGRRLQ